MKTTTLPKRGLGNAILKVLGTDPNKKFSTSELNQLSSLLTSTIALIQQFRAKYNFTNGQLSEVIQELFPRPRWDNHRMDCCNRLTQCYEEMFIWARERIRKDKQVPFSIIRNGTIDAASQRFLGKSFCSSICIGRSFRWIPKDVFEQAARWYYYDIPPQRLPSEFMIIFEMRQSLEVAVRRIIGFDTISPPLKLRHDTVWNILKHHLSKKNFSPQGRIGLDHIKRVYDWTEPSIHMMETDFTCIAWKAIQIVEQFFQPTRRKNGACSIYDSFEIEESLLKTMQNDFVRKLNSCPHNGLSVATIKWIKPDAAIVDRSGRAIAIKPRKETITF